jgi:hypothetical protein
LSSDPAENAPLLARTDEEEQTTNGGNRILGVYDPSKPLTKLERLLAVAAILFLVISGVFIGLFAATERSLKKERQHHHRPPNVPSPPDDSDVSLLD